MSYTVHWCVCHLEYMRYCMNELNFCSLLIYMVYKCWNYENWICTEIIKLVVINLPSITDKMCNVLENFQHAFKVITSFSYNLKVLLNNVINPIYFVVVLYKLNILICCCFVCQGTREKKLVKLIWSQNNATCEEYGNELYSNNVVLLNYVGYK